jgi:hypothetical protein
MIRRIGGYRASDLLFLCRLQGKQTGPLCVMCASALAPHFELW